MNNINRIKRVSFTNPILLSFLFENKEIGKLIIKDNKLEFMGNAGTSAKILFNQLKPYIDNYIKEKLEMIN